MADSLHESLHRNIYVCETLDVSDADRIHVDANQNNIHIFPLKEDE